MLNKNTIIRNIFKYTDVFAIFINDVIHWDLYEKGGININRLIDFL